MLCIKRKRGRNAQVRMMNAKFLRPWEVLDLNIPELATNHKPKTGN